jgi:hypothetical protein
MSPKKQLVRLEAPEHQPLAALLQGGQHGTRQLTRARIRLQSR